MQQNMKTFPMSVDAYLEAEKESGVKHEYVNGYIHAMVGSSRRHNLLAVTISRLLGNHLQGTGCDVFVSDMKVKAGGKTENVFFYPDVMVSCNRHQQSRYIEEEPRLIVEVLSPSTEHFDRLAKLEAYTQIPTLEEYLLVDQRDMKIDLYRRSGEQWLLTRHGESDVIELSSINYSVAVTSIYQDVIGLI
ncbi:MAG: Uma2 family endonuclease [Endozoicomonas sp.]